MYLELADMVFDSPAKVEEMINKLDKNCKLAYGNDYCKQFDSKVKSINIKAWQASKSQKHRESREK